MGFSWQEYWRGLPSPPEHLPDLGISWTSISCICRQILYHWATWMHACMLQSCPTLLHHGPQPARLLCPWDFHHKNTAVSCYSLLQGIFLTQGLNLQLSCLLHWQAGSSPHLGSPHRNKHICPEILSGTLFGTLNISQRSAVIQEAFLQE